MSIRNDPVLSKKQVADKEKDKESKTLDKQLKLLQDAAIESRKNLKEGKDKLRKLRRLLEKAKEAVMSQMLVNEELYEETMKKNNVLNTFVFRNMIAEKQQLLNKNNTQSATNEDD